jgi:hypothetical protein
VLWHPACLYIGVNAADMKQIITFLTLTFFTTIAFASVGPLPAPSAVSSAKSVKVANAGAVRFDFTNLKSQDNTDSVLVIFDKFDHTGAGIIFQVFAADNESAINISGIPAGKYYVTIQCMGLHHDRFEKTITIKKQKNEKVHIELEASEAFSKDNVKIPVYHTSLSNLSIINSK